MPATSRGLGIEAGRGRIREFHYPMAGYANILTTNEGGVFTITLNRPRKKNAVDSNTYLELVDALTCAAQDCSVMMAVLTGTGDYFCSGADLTEFAPCVEAAQRAGGKMSLQSPVTRRTLPNDVFSSPVGRFMITILRFPKILVAAVNGPAVGIGVTVLAHCDLVYASEEATFWVPFTRIAVVPEFGSSVAFSRIMGKAMAGDVLLAARPLSAAEALSCGLVSRLFPTSELLSGMVSADCDTIRCSLMRELRSVCVSSSKRE